MHTADPTTATLPGPWLLTTHTIEQDPRVHGPGSRTVVISHAPPPADLLADLATAGHLVCAFTFDTLPARPAGPPRCLILADATGRHPGEHTDAIYRWDNHDTLPSAPPAPRRRGVVAIGESDLARLVRPGPGQRIIGLRYDVLRLAVLVHLEGPGLPEVPEGGDPPLIRTSYAPPPTFDRVDVTNLPPQQQHDTVLAQLADALEHTAPAATLLTSDISVPAHATWTGADSLIRRHHPGEPWYGRLECAHCGPPADGPVFWPCPDYVDIATGVVTGLQAAQ
jgi:hypothetical protein